MFTLLKTKIISLFYKQQDPSEQPVIKNKHFRSFPFHMCNICHTTNVKITKYHNFTEQCCMPFSDENNNIHDHDNSNHGTVTILCCNNHSTETQYHSACECGWGARRRAPSP